MSHVTQGDNTATGGNATANGGNGGNADTGNTQFLNGNAGRSRSAGAARQRPRVETPRPIAERNGGNGGNATPTAATPTPPTTPRSGRATALSAAARDPSRRTSRDRPGRQQATGGNATANGGNGGNADTGNTQFATTATLAPSPFGGGNSEAEAEGGDTGPQWQRVRRQWRQTPRAHGGNANASNNAPVHQVNSSSGSSKPSWSGCEHSCYGSRLRIRAGERVDVYQGDNTATGGNATANGGDGGNADTGNNQVTTPTP